MSVAAFFLVSAVVNTMSFQHGFGEAVWLKVGNANFANKEWFQVKATTSLLNLCYWSWIKMVSIAVISSAFVWKSILAFKHL